MQYKLIFFATILTILYLNASCVVETDKGVKNKLKAILEDDLAAIVEDIADSSLLDSVYYDITLYKDYKEGKYSKKAVVDFYFLKGISSKITRKYRYFKAWGKWDRYYNEWSTIPNKKSSD